MATKKQQRRRYQRARAHGRGIDAQDERPDDEAQSKSRGRSSGKSAPARGRGIPKEPSLSRAVKRSGVLCAVFLALLLYTPLGGKQTPGQKALFAVWMFVMFTGVTLLTERWAWKRYQKQQGKL